MNEPQLNPTSPPAPPSALRLVKPWGREDSTGSARRLLKALNQGCWVGAGRYAKITGEDFVYVGRLDVEGTGVDVALKQIVAPRGLAGVIDSIRPNRRSLRQWVGAERLNQLGVRAARPILLAAGSKAGARFDWLLVEHIAGATVLDHLHRNDLPWSDQWRTARQVGKLVARIDSYGWFNRDCKLSNLIRTPDGQIVVIDTVGVQRRPGKRVRMLSAMLAEAVGHGALPRRSLLMRCLKNAVDDPRDAWRTLDRLAASQSESWRRTVLHETPGATEP